MTNSGREMLSELIDPDGDERLLGYVDAVDQPIAM